MVSSENFFIYKEHTLYLSFLLHRQDFRKPNFTHKKTTKGTKTTKNVSEKVKYMHFFHSIWKNLHLTENFYTDMSVVSVTIPHICHFFTQAKFLENKIYTKKTRKLRQNTQ